MFRDVKNYPDVQPLPDESVHYADGWKNSDGNEPSQNPNGDKSDILSDPSPDAE